MTNDKTKAVLVSSRFPFHFGSIISTSHDVSFKTRFTLDSLAFTLKGYSDS